MRSEYDDKYDDCVAGCVMALWNDIQNYWDGDVWQNGSKIEQAKHKKLI